MATFGDNIDPVFTNPPQAKPALQLDNVDGKLGTLTGLQLEHRIHRDIPGTACRWLRLNRLRILQSLQVPRSPEFQDLIDDAEELGVITFDQGDHLEQTDIMLSARRRDDQRTVHMAISLFRDIANDDVSLARERADTLSTIMGTPAIPIVIGSSIAPAQQEFADSLGVTTIIVPRLVI